MVGQLVLFFKGKQLEDVSITLDECGIKHMDFIQLFQDGLVLIVVYETEHGEHVHTELRCFETIGMLKEKLQVLIGIPKEQCLLYDEWRLDDDGKRLVDYGIEGAVEYDETNKKTPSWNDCIKEYLVNIHAYSAKAAFFPKRSVRFDLRCTIPPPAFLGECHSSAFEIVVEIPNMAWWFPLTVKLSDTIGTVRKSIIEKYYMCDELLGPRYIEKGIFVFLFGTKHLKDESVTLDEYGIKHVDSIQLLEGAPFRIYISGIGNPTLEMRSFNTVGMLKDRLQDLTDFLKRSCIWHSMTNTSWS